MIPVFYFFLFIQTSPEHILLSSGEKFIIVYEEHFSEKNGYSHYKITASRKDIDATFWKTDAEIRYREEDAGKSVKIILTAENSIGSKESKIFFVRFDQKNSIMIESNSPNPFKPKFHALTRINYSLKNSGKVVINIYNSRGKFIRNLLHSVQEAGTYNFIGWNGKDYREKYVPAGTYIIVISSNGKIVRRPLTVLR